MNKYDYYFIDNDVFRNKKHITLLLGYIEKENCCYVVASYSKKTKHIIIKDIENIPPTEALKKLVEEGKKEQ